MTGAHTAFLPRHALVNDLWTGFVPEELQGLTRVEVSMIAQVNPLLNITVLPTSGSSCLKAFQYSVVNDVPSIFAQMPHRPAGDVLYNLSMSNRPIGGGIPTTQSDQPRSWQFRPAKVMAAVRWLRAHNADWASIPGDLDLFQDATSNTPEDTVTLDVDDEDISDVDAAMRTVNTGVSTNPHANTFEAETLYLRSEPPTSQDDFLRDVLTSGQAATSVPTITRAQPTEFSHPYHDSMFYEKCFPNLFPYGIGGPGDVAKHGLTQDEHVKWMLHQGGDRRFQRYAPYYFTHYAYKMRRRVGGIAAVAASRSAAAEAANDHDSDDSDVDHETNEVNTDNSDNMFTAAAMRDAIDTSQHAPTSQSHPQIRKFLSRLAPYGDKLPGTPIHINSEKNKLHAMVQSDTVQNDGKVSSPDTHTYYTYVHRKQGATIELTWVLQVIVHASMSTEHHKQPIPKIIGSMHLNFSIHDCESLLCQYVNRQVSWFTTFASADPHHDDIFRIITGTDPHCKPICDASTTAERDRVIRLVDEYSDQQRVQLLGEHPALQARIFLLKMDGLWLHVIRGQHKPLGFLSDLWRRIEFQKRGVPHEHALSFVSNKAPIDWLVKRTRDGALIDALGMHEDDGPFPPKVWDNDNQVRFQPTPPRILP